MITDLAANVQKQLATTAKDFEAFSISHDEIIDVSNPAQCAVFIKGVDSNLKEEFLELISLKGITTGRDIFLSLGKMQQ